MNLQLISDPRVESVFTNYPDHIRPKMLNLRRLVLEVAEESDDIDKLEETLKWGEPSYLTKIGSTVRVDWKAKSPDQYAVYFKCTSKLVPAFKKVYQKVFNFEGNRAIIFNSDEKIPEPELKKCVHASLTYHKVKHLPDLGLE
jgi:hypothetical protein